MSKRRCLFILIPIFLTACSTDISIHLPQGPQGPEGPSGNDGRSAYELWVEEVNNGSIPWNIEETDLADFFRYLKGQDGQDGQDGNNGSDGQSAYEL